MPVTKKTNLLVLVSIPVVLGVVILGVALIIYTGSLMSINTGTTSSTLTTEESSSSELAYTNDVNVETAKLRTCTSKEIFENGRFTPSAHDMEFVDSIDDILYKDEPYALSINLNARFGGSNDGTLSHAEIFFKGVCNYPLFNYSFSPYDVIATYFSFNEKKVYFLTYDESKQTDAKTTTLTLEAYNLEKLAVDSKSALVLPVANSVFLAGRTEGDLIAELPTKYFFQDSMISVQSQKMYVSLSPVVNCFGGDQSLCYYKDEYNISKKLEKENLGGVYEIDIKTGVSKKVYSSQMLTSDGFLTKIDIVKLNNGTAEFFIYFKDIREKVTKL